MCIGDLRYIFVKLMFLALLLSSVNEIQWTLQVFGLEYPDSRRNVHITEIKLVDNVISDNKSVLLWLSWLTLLQRARILLYP